MHSLPRRPSTSEDHFQPLSRQDAEACQEVGEDFSEGGSPSRRRASLGACGRLPNLSWRLATALLALGCLAPACLHLARPRPREKVGPLFTSGDGAVGFVEVSEKQWQCKGDTTIGATMDSREQDVNSSTGHARCCECYGLGSLGKMNGMTPKPCAGPVTWHEAKAICMQLGKRLCTKEELMDGEASNTGCDYDTKYVWTTSKPYGFAKTGHGTVCRADKNDKTTDGYGTAIVLTLGPREKCEEKCLKENACRGYEFRSSERRCEIWTKPIQHHDNAVHMSEFDCKEKLCPH